MNITMLPILVYFLQNGLSCLHLRHTLECPAIVSFLVEKAGVPVDYPTDVRSKQINEILTILANFKMNPHRETI